MKENSGRAQDDWRIVNAAFRGKLGRNTGLRGRQPSHEDWVMMWTELPAQLRAWVECPRCGRMDKLVRDFRLPAGETSPMLEKVGLACER